MLSFATTGTVAPPTVTPMLRDESVWVKPERCQHSGSVKYRMVYAKLKAAIALGTVTPTTVLTEVTSGSTGVALAALGKLLGLRVELHAYANIDPAKRARIQEHGADLSLHPLDTPMGDLLGAVAERMRGGGWWHLNQYDRRSTALSYQALGNEVTQQIYSTGAEPPSLFACPVGTGGLIQGLGSCLRRAFPGLRVVAVEPEPGASIDGMRNTQIAWLGDGDPYDRNFPDERITVAAPTERATLHGQSLGWSGSAVLHAVRSRSWKNVLLIAAD